MCFQQPGQKLVIVPHTFGESTQPIGSFLWDNPRVRLPAGDVSGRALQL